MKLITCRLQLKAFQSELLSNAYKMVEELAKKGDNIKLSGLISLPTQTKKITVNRSPHIDKKSREQFEVRTYSRSLHVFTMSESSDGISDFVEKLKKVVFFGLNIKVVFTYKDVIVL